MDIEPPFIRVSDNHGLRSNTDDSDRIDREQESQWQLYERCGSNGRRSWEELVEQRVEQEKGVGIRDKARNLDDVSETGPGVLEHCLQICESLPGLHLKGIAGNETGGGIDSRLARGVYETPNADCL
jgi:hypothetical protein